MWVDVHCTGLKSNEAVDRDIRPPPSSGGFQPLGSFKPFTEIPAGIRKGVHDSFHLIFSKEAKVKYNHHFSIVEDSHGQHDGKVEDNAQTQGNEPSLRDPDEDGEQDELEKQCCDGEQGGKGRIIA